MQVYPNPATQIINVQYTSTKGSAVIFIADLAGRVVMNQTVQSIEGVNQLQLDLSKLAKGAYMLNVQSAVGNNQVKIVME